MKRIIILCWLLTAFFMHSIAGSIQGTVRYSEMDQRLMRAVKVVLLNESLIVIDSTWSDTEGAFSFSSLSPGVYQIRISPNHPWSGVNSTDAFLVLKHFVQLSLLSGLSVVAADVDQSQDINSLDALLIARRFTGQITTFPAGNWAFENLFVQTGDADTSFVVLLTLCMGDVDQSHIPNNNQFLICTDSLTDSRDGKRYATTEIGSQCWMKQNMNLGTMIPGTADQANNGIFEKYCYNDIESNCLLYGGLYQWTEMMQYTSIQKAQGICPSGFHIPSDNEWSILVDFLGGDSIAGGKLKETGILFWSSPNAGASNESGFSARGGGNRIGSGTYLNLNTESKIWSSTYHNTNSAWYRNLYNSNPWVFQNNHGKNNGLSVRCLRN